MTAVRAAAAALSATAALIALPAAACAHGNDAIGSAVDELIRAFTEPISSLSPSRAAAKPNARRAAAKAARAPQPASRRATFPSTSGRPREPVAAAPAGPPAARVTYPPTEAPTVAAASAPRVAPLAAATDDSFDSTLARRCAAVVRAYLSAVMRGDRSWAYASFGAAPGDRRVDLIERGILDDSSRVTRLESHTTAPGEATVTVDLQTAAGPYFARYHLKRSTRGLALIERHELIKL